MTESFRLGRIFSIPVGLHWSAGLLAAMIGFTLFGTVLPLAAPNYSSFAYLFLSAVIVVSVMASIIAHELGHALVARNNGVGTNGITLFALGGVAKLDAEPTTPGAAGRIAVAGPMVSLVIGLGSIMGWWLASAVGLPSLIALGFLWIGAANLVMAVFNMIPALPLDGGRVLQAVLWHRNGNSDRATISAARLGRYLGWAIVAFGLWSLLNGGAGLWTMLVGWFVVTSARAESLRAKFRLRSREWAPPLWWQQAAHSPGGPVDDRHDPLAANGGVRRRGPIIDVEPRPER